MQIPVEFFPLRANLQAPSGACFLTCSVGSWGAAQSGLHPLVTGVVKQLQMDPGGEAFIGDDEFIFSIR